MTMKANFCEQTSVMSRCIKISTCLWTLSYSIFFLNNITTFHFNLLSKKSTFFISMKLYQHELANLPTLADFLIFKTHTQLLYCPLHLQ